MKITTSDTPAVGIKSNVNLIADNNTRSRLLASPEMVIEAKRGSLGVVRINNPSERGDNIESRANIALSAQNAPNVATVNHGAMSVTSGVAARRGLSSAYGTRSQASKRTGASPNRRLEIVIGK